MTWNVYRYNIDDRTIEVFNIFDHWVFAKEVKKLKQERLTEIEFNEELRRTLMYYFWCKYEWETVITTFPPYIGIKELNRLNEVKDDCWCTYERYPTTLTVGLETETKIDVYQQVMLNWKVFVDYVWRSDLND